MSFAATLRAFSGFALYLLYTYIILIARRPASYIFVCSDGPRQVFEQTYLRFLLFLKTLRKRRGYTPFFLGLTDELA